MTRPNPISKPVAEGIAQRLSLVGTPLHIRLISFLNARGATNVQTLADELSATQQSVSKALARLHRGGIVRRRSEGRRVWYFLVDPTVVTVYEHAADGLIHAASQAMRLDTSEHPGRPVGRE